MGNYSNPPTRVFRYPRAILELIAQLTKLPGVGPKTAERLALNLASRPKSDLDAFSQALLGLPQLHRCRECGGFGDEDPCDICRSPSRDPQLLCVVAKQQDVLAIERTKQFAGRYHVLGGTVRPYDGTTLDDLRLSPLLDRIQRQRVREVIFAFNVDVEGEGTILALKQALKPLVQSHKLRLTKLARGLPMGSDVEYADEVTLSSALAGRREI